MSVTQSELALADAGNWFLHSKIQNLDGGIARWYRADYRVNAPTSTEITGYALSTLVRLYAQTGDASYLSRAKDLARFLVGTWDGHSGAMPFEVAVPNNEFSYFFDTGIIARGLLALWRKCEDPEYLHTARLCGDSMARHFRCGENYAPILSLPQKEAAPYQRLQWSQAPGCYQLKAALCWYELWEITGERLYFTSYQELLTETMLTHDSFLPGTDEQPKIMDRLHAYLYFMEGLLPYAGQDTSRAVIRSGLERVRGFIEAIRSQFLRSDVVAQLLRLQIYADQYEIVSLDLSNTEPLVRILESFQENSMDPRLRGGFWFGTRNDAKLPFMNPWCTAFAYQALTMWSERNQCQWNWRDLI